MKIAIMQPYFFPYMGYFQLISASDTFVFLDDVNHIKRGWVHRNRICINQQPSWISLNLVKASQNKLINEIEILDAEINRKKMLKSIEMNYKKSLFFEDVFPAIEEIINEDEIKMSDFLIKGIIGICKLVGIDKDFKISSDIKDLSTLKGQNKLIGICHSLNASIYINAPGGKDLYSNADFKKAGIELLFLEPVMPKYKQFGDEFVQYLSIIDVLMHNGTKQTLEYIEKFSVTG